MAERPAPRWVHLWACLTLAVTVALLVLGQLVTTFRAGMADPVWPTEPWYIFATAEAADRERYGIDFGYFVEHTHRMAGFTVGAVASVLALGVWWTDPRRAARWFGLALLMVLLMWFGMFHGQMMAQKDAARITWPVPTIAVMGASLGGVLLVALSGVVAGARGAWLRLVAVLALVGVMTQGLLGGFRVRLNDLFGTDLAAVHGVFAQVVFSLLAAVTVLTAKPPVVAWRGDARRRVGLLAWHLVALLLLQLVWGALVRHAANPLNQRLHFLTAFLVVAAAVVLIRTVLADRTAPRGATAAGLALAGLVVLQVALGVEAWMGKFGVYVLPGKEKVTPVAAAIRTGHTLIGTTLLAVSVALAVRTRVAAVPAGGDVESAAAAGLADPHQDFAAAGISHSGGSR